MVADYLLVLYLSFLVPRPPAPEGWDKEVTATHPHLSHQHYSTPKVSNTHLLDTTHPASVYSAAYLSATPPVLDCPHSLCLYLIQLAGPSPPARRVGIKDLALRTVNAIILSTTIYSNSSSGCVTAPSSVPIHPDSIPLIVLVL